MANNKLDKYLGNIRREEHYESLVKLPDIDLCEMVRAHFESHSTMPGEKALKDRVNYEIGQLRGIFEEGLGEPSDALLQDSVKQEIARGYAETRIRETKFEDINGFAPGDLKRTCVAVLDEESGYVGYDKNNPVRIDTAKVELQNNNVDVYVLAELENGGYKTIGKLPENFLHNNPMNVESCEAELQLIDYSNGKMKNVSARVVVDTDLMSGDVIDLDEDMLKGLEQESGMEQ